MKYNSCSYKATVLMLFLGFITNVAHAQLQELETSTTNWVTVGEIKWLSNTKASLKYFTSSNDTTYQLYLQDEEKLKNNRDMTVRKYFSINFSGQDNTAGKLYDLLIAFFTPENRNDKKRSKIFTLGKEMLHVQHYPKLTAAAIMLSTKQHHIILTQREIKKLFNHQ